MTISQTAKEAAERILRCAHDPIACRKAAEIVQSTIDAETERFRVALETVHGELLPCRDLMPCPAGVEGYTEGYDIWVRDYILAVLYPKP